MSDLYRDFIDQKADQIINSLGGTITPAVPNELYRDFLDRKFDDVINAIGNVKVKSFTYTGTGTDINNIIFPETPKFVLKIEHRYIDNAQPYGYINNLIWNYSLAVNQYKQSGSAAFVPTILNTSYTNNTLTLYFGTSPGRALNINNVEYTVYYI